MERVIDILIPVLMFCVPLAASLIAKANAGTGVNIQRLIAQCDNSPRRIYDELMKANR